MPCAWVENERRPSVFANRGSTVPRRRNAEERERRRDSSEKRMKLKRMMENAVGLAARQVNGFCGYSP